MWLLLIYKAAVGFGKEIVLKLSCTAPVLVYLPYANRLSLWWSPKVSQSLRETLTSSTTSRERSKTCRKERASMLSVIERPPQEKHVWVSTPLCPPDSLAFRFLIQTGLELSPKPLSWNHMTQVLLFQDTIAMLSSLHCFLLWHPKGQFYFEYTNHTSSLLKIRWAVAMTSWGF